MNNTIKITLQLLLLSVSSHIICMNKKEQKEYQKQCLIIQKKYQQKLQEYQNNLQNKSLKDLEEEKNSLATMLLTKKRNLFSVTLEHHKIDTILCNKEVLLTSLDIHYGIGCLCIPKNTKCTKKLPIILVCYNNPDATLSLLQDIPEKYYNNFTLQDYEHMYLISMYHKKLALINNVRPFIFMQDACKTLSTLRNINSHIPQNK